MSSILSTRPAAETFHAAGDTSSEFAKVIRHKFVSPGVYTVVDRII